MRWKHWGIVLSTFLFPWGSALAQVGEGGPSNPAVGAGLFLGFQNGPAFQFTLQASDFAQGLPIKARLRVGRTGVEPGDPGDARRIFINDATNGTPREAGETWDLGLDAILPFSPHAGVLGGVRYSRFKANFKYVGGNEDFDVTSAHWGLAGGLEGNYPMGEKTTLLISGGGEYFFQARLVGHDTSYSPDGDDVNPRKDYGYADADRAVDQPVWRPFLLVGFSYRVGG